MTKIFTMVIISIVSLIVTQTTAASTFATHFAMAQRSDIQDTNANMTSAMVELARLHLSDADKALKSGNTTKAGEQLTLAQLQISMMNMKTMMTLNQTQAMSFMKGMTVTGGGMISPKDIKMVPDNCIILNGGVLECRDPLTQSISLSK
jgi:hypothetical protein